MALTRHDPQHIETRIRELVRQYVGLGARHGVPAICQKPFAESLEDAQAMVRACADAGVQLMVHENFRWPHPAKAANGCAPC